MKNATHLENFIQVVWKYFRVFSCYFGNILDFFSCCLEMFWKLYPVILEICIFVKKNVCHRQRAGQLSRKRKKKRTLAILQNEKSSKEKKEKENTFNFAK